MGDIVYNDNGKLVYASPIVKSTGEVFTKYNTTDLTEFKQGVVMDNKVKSIINAAFSPSQKQLVKGSALSTNICINTTTGKVDLVYFGFFMSSNYKSIPISVFR